MNLLMPTSDPLDMFDKLAAELERSWPKRMEEMIKRFDHGGEDFYVYTFCKWKHPHHDRKYVMDNNGDLSEITFDQKKERTFEVYHQPRKTRPDPLPGTTCRVVSPKRGAAQILWTLPHQEGFELYQQGKIFADPFIADCIRKYLSGELAKEPVEKFQKV